MAIMDYFDQRDEQQRRLETRRAAREGVKRVIITGGAFVLIAVLPLGAVVGIAEASADLSPRAMYLLYAGLTVLAFVAGVVWSYFKEL